MSDNHSLEQIFHIGNKPIPYILQKNGLFCTQEKGGSNILISPTRSENIEVRYDESRLVFHSRCELPAVMNIVMYPMKSNSENMPIIKPFSVTADTDVLTSGFHVEKNGITDTFLISDDGYAKMSVSNSDIDIEFEGEYLLLRENDFIMLNGRYLRIGSKVLADFSQPCQYYANFQ